MFPPPVCATTVPAELADLPLSPGAAEAERLLQGVFGFDSLRPGQGQVIEAVLKGRHVLAVMPTGAGKSLCY